MIMTTWLSLRVTREREGVLHRRSDPELRRFPGCPSNIQDESRLTVHILKNPTLCLLGLCFLLGGRNPNNLIPSLMVYQLLQLFHLQRLKPPHHKPRHDLWRPI